MRMLYRLVAGMILSVLTLPVAAVASAAATVDVATARGTVAVAAPPRTVAVFDIAAVDTLARLGVRPEGLPVKLYVPELEPLAAGATPVGPIYEPDLEALSALAPDLIIIGGRSSHRLDAVRRVAPAIDMTLDGRDLLVAARARIAAYGALFGREAEARAAAAELEAGVESARAAVRGKGTALIVMTNGPKLTAYGPESRFGWLHAELDLPPAVPGLGAATHGEVVSFEFVRRADPDWLIVVDRAAAIGEPSGAAGATLDNELVAGTAAGRAGRILHLPPADAYIAAGGVSATLRVLARIEEAFRAAR